MLYRRWVIPPRLEELWGLTPRLAEALARKESSDCAWCGAKLRARRLARVVLETYPVGSPPAPAVARRVGRVARGPAAAGRRDQPDRGPARGSSAPCPASPTPITTGRQAGRDDRRRPLRGPDRLTYPDASFDLVLTSETLEHVPDLDAALAEIRRVLVPGGRHVFTVPLLPGVPKTFARPSSRPDGSIEHRATADPPPRRRRRVSRLHRVRGRPARDPRAGRVRGRGPLRPDDRGRPGPGLRLPEARA